MVIRGFGLRILGAAAVALSACGQGPRPPGDVSAQSAWARATAPVQESGGVFLTIRGGGAPDRLVGGSSPTARTVEIHTITMDGSVMRMRRRASIDIPPHELVKLGPGGTHLMLVGLKAPLTTGRTFDLTLDFAGAGRKTVAVRVLPITATGLRDAGDE